MRITDIKVQVLAWPYWDRTWWMSLTPVSLPTEVVVRIRTDSGATGMGHSDQFPGAASLNTSGEAVAGRGPGLIPELIKPLLIGEDPALTEDLWKRMFALTHARGWSTYGYSRAQYLAALAAVDMALWDVKAKSQGVPVRRMLGAGGDRVECYIAGGYYTDGMGTDRLAEECRRHVELGHRGIKMRVGGASLEEDVARVAAVRKAVGPDVRLMLDANQAYDSGESVRAAKAFAPYDIFWFEEPARWYETEETLKAVGEQIGIPIASGEQLATHHEAAAHIERTGLRYMQFDCGRTGGPTEFMRVAAVSSARGALMAPHHSPHIHAQLVAAVPNGKLVEMFAEPENYDPELRTWVRWDKKRDMFSVFPEVEDGFLKLTDLPGWGVELDEDIVQERLVAEL